MENSLSENHYKTLDAVDAKQHGHSVTIDSPEAEYCMEHGLIRFVQGKYFELTDEGREILQRWGNYRYSDNRD